MTIQAIPILKDNYIWLLNPAQECIIIDPGVASPVINYLTQQQLTPTAILLTHHHQDHVGGVIELIEQYPQINIHGPAETAQYVGQRLHIVEDNMTLQLGKLTIQVLATPGHTLGHICYYSQPFLFCGDTLFSAGCGRIFEGTPQQLYESLQRLATLPDDTQVCCAHEFTLNNLLFAHHLLPDDKMINQALTIAQEKSIINQPTLPSQLYIEKRINLFLRCSELIVKKTLSNNQIVISDLDAFTKLRKLKDKF